MEHHQTVARTHNGTPGCWTTVWSVSTKKKYGFQVDPRLKKIYAYIGS